jgi:hypothetical protein
MDNTSIDKLTRDILASSKLELTSPNFDSILMNKIKFESRKQSIFHNTALYFFIFISIDTMIFSLLKMIHISITDMISKVNAFIHVVVANIQNSPSNIGLFLLIYFLILAVVIFCVNIVSGSRYRYLGM